MPGASSRVSEAAGLSASARSSHGVSTGLTQITVDGQNHDGPDARPPIWDELRRKVTDLAPRLPPGEAKRHEDPRSSNNRGHHQPGRGGERQGERSGQPHRNRRRRSNGGPGRSPGQNAA